MGAIQKKIISEMSWPLKLYFLKETGKQKNVDMAVKGRRVGIEALGLGPARRQEEAMEAGSSDDSKMKMKLFRLMYATVRDSDLKIKSAELIKTYYANSTAFNVGYLMGDITDKFNVMIDISNTIKRFYDEWKPIEHINAYEVITNQAIELGQISYHIYQTAKHDPMNEQSPIL